MLKTQEKTQGTWKIIDRKNEKKYLMKNIKAYCNEVENYAKLTAEIYFFNGLATGADAATLMFELLAENEKRTITATDMGYSYTDGLWLKRYDVEVNDTF